MLHSKLNYNYLFIGCIFIFTYIYTVIFPWKGSYKLPWPSFFFKIHHCLYFSFIAHIFVGKVWTEFSIPQIHIWIKYILCIYLLQIILNKLKLQHIYKHTYNIINTCTLFTLEYWDFVSTDEMVSFSCFGGSNLKSRLLVGDVTKVFPVTLMSKWPGLFLLTIFVIFWSLIGVLWNSQVTMFYYILCYIYYVY